MTSNDGQHRLHQSYKAGNGSEDFLDSLFVCLFDEGFSRFPLHKVKKRNQKRKTLHKSWSKRKARVKNKSRDSKSHDSWKILCSVIFWSTVLKHI